MNCTEQRKHVLPDHQGSLQCVNSGRPEGPQAKEGEGTAANKTLLSPAECQACSSCSRAFIFPQFMLLETCSQLFSSVSPAHGIPHLQPYATPFALHHRHGAER